MSWKGMDLVVRIVGDLKRYRADLREAGRDTQQAMGQAKAATDGLTAAQRGLEGQAGRTAGQLVDVGRAAASGDYARAGQQVAGMASSMSTAATGAGALGSMLAVATAALAGYLVVSYKAADEHERQANLLALTGNAAGLVAGDMNRMASRAAEAGNTTVGAARDIAEALVGTGKVGRPALESLGTAIALVTRASGESEAQVTGDFAKMADGVAKWAAEHNERYHFLTLDQYRYIQALEDAGQKQQAMKVVGEAFITHLKDIDDNVGTLQRAWRSLGQAASWAWDKMMNWGRADTTQDRLKEAEQKVKAAQSSLDFFRSQGRSEDSLTGPKQALADAQATLETLKETAVLERRAADAKAARAEATAAAIAKEIEDEEAKKRNKTATDKLTAAEKALREERDREAKFRQIVIDKEAEWAEEAAKAARQSAEVEAFFRQKEIDAEQRWDKQRQDAADKLREDERKAWEKTWDQVSESFTDALMQGGKSLKDYLAGLFRTLVLRPILAPVGAAFASMLGGPAAAGQGGGSGMGSLSSLQKLLNPSKIFSSFGDSLAFAADSAGEWLMNNTSGMLNQLGGKLMGNAGSIGTAGSYFAGAAAGVGIGRTISGGYSAIGSSGNTAVNAGTIIGAIFGGPVGAAIGGSIGGMVNRLFGRKLKDSGIEGTFSEASGFDGREFQFYKGGVFRSDKTTYSAMDATLQGAMGKQYQALTAQTREFADVLGLSASALDGFTTDVRVSFKGLTDEQVQAKLAKTFATVGDRQAQRILGTFDAATKTWEGGPFVREGEKAGEALRRLGGSLALTNNLFDALGQKLFEASLQGADYASSLVDQFGGMDAMRESTMAYFGAFYSDTERLGAASRQMTKDMAALGLTLPKSRKGFRELVDAQDLTTESGRETYAALIKLSPAFAELTAAMEQAGQSVTEEIRRLRGLDGISSAAGLADLQTQFALGTAAARAGDAAALQRLPELSKAVESAAALQAVTSADVALIRGQLTASLSETLRVLGLDVPAFAVGTNYVPRTMLAQIHEGEAIVPRAYNPAAGGGATGNAEIAQLLRSLLTEMQGARYEGRSTAEHTAKTARILDRVARDGEAFVTVSEAA